MLGILRILLVPSFLGIGISLSFPCLHWCTEVFRISSSSSLFWGDRDALPSTPAVFLPAFNWVTWRIASNLALRDFSISFCKFNARFRSEPRIAFHNRICRRNKSFLSFRGWVVFPKFTMSVISHVSNHALLHFLCSECLEAITLRPTQCEGFRASSRLLGFRPVPRLHHRFSSFRFPDCFWQIRFDHFAFIHLWGISDSQ